MSAVERAETVLNAWALGKRPEPLRVRLRLLQRNPQLGGSLRTGHYGRLLWRPSAPKRHNWRLSAPLPSWKPTPPLFLGDAAEYRRRRQLRRREALRLQHRRSPLKPLPLGTKRQLMDREPRLQLLLDEHRNYFRKPSGMRTWIARRRQRLQLRQAYHRPRHGQWLAELLRRAYPQSRGLAWLGLRSGYADGLQGLRRLSCYEGCSQQNPRALLRLLRGWGGGLRRSLPRRRLLAFQGSVEGRPGGTLAGFLTTPQESPVALRFHFSKVSLLGTPSPVKVRTLWGPRAQVRRQSSAKAPSPRGDFLVRTLGYWQQSQNQNRRLQPKPPKARRRPGKRRQRLIRSCRQAAYPVVQSLQTQVYPTKPTRASGVQPVFGKLPQSKLRKQPLKRPAAPLHGTSALLVPGRSRSGTFLKRRRSHFRKLCRLPYRGRVRRLHPFRLLSQDYLKRQNPRWRF